LTNIFGSVFRSMTSDLLRNNDASGNSILSYTVDLIPDLDEVD
jgi:hypothetical protein